MKPKLLATTAVVGTVALAAFGYGVATSAGADQAAPASLHFLLREEFVPLDEAKPGPSNYERAVLRGTLLDPNTKKPRGTELGVCIAVDVRNEGRVVCQVVFAPAATRALSVADQITAQTIFDDVQTSKPQRTAITGGTGRYAGVSGELVARPAANNLIDVVFRFQS